MFATNRLIGFALFALSATACIDDSTADETSTEAALRWDHLPTDTTAVICPANLPRINEVPSVGDAKSNSIILHDADVFWNQWGYGDAPPDAEAQDIKAAFMAGTLPGWDMQQRTAAYVQMYDLLAPVDKCRADMYLERLRLMADMLLQYRDDKRYIPPQDGFRNRVMAAWGYVSNTYDGRRNSDVVAAGNWAYPMAAFARRVAANPSAFSDAYKNDAIRFTTAVIETHISFRSNMYLPEANPADPKTAWGYYKLPESFTTLQCNLPNAGSDCTNARINHGQPVSYNEGMAMMKALADATIAANSDLYKLSPDSPAKQVTLYYASNEVPRLIAKNVAFFTDPQNLWRHVWGSDKAPYYLWKHEYHSPTGRTSQDTGHAQFELGSLAVVVEDQARLNEILAAAGRPERIALTPDVMKPFATTFLRLIWHYDFSNPNGVRNMLSEDIDGSGSFPGKRNVECAGFLPLAQFDPWVWVRCHDTTFWHDAPTYLRIDNHAALLRYR